MLSSWLNIQGQIDHIKLKRKNTLKNRVYMWKISDRCETFYTALFFYINQSLTEIDNRHLSTIKSITSGLFCFSIKKKCFSHRWMNKG
jgi:hypothetical protein